MLRSDIPLDRNAAGLFLPAIIGFMVFLAGLAFAGSMAVDNLLAQWRSSIDSAFTVQLPAVEGESAEAAAARRQAALDVIGGIRGVASATLLSEADKARLLAPWLGAEAGALNLPLPDLIAVALAPGSRVDLAALSAALQQASPGAGIDDHGRWRDAMAGVTRGADLALLGLLLLIGGAAALTVVFVTRAGLSAHRRVIEILHLIGAHDGYIAGQFQRHALSRGLLGGLIGAGAAAAVFLGAERFLPALGGIALMLGAAQWAAFGLLPLAGALLAMATARYTVLRALRRIL
jgi:cell division transport system permease protein